MARALSRSSHTRLDSIQLANSPATSSDFNIVVWNSASILVRSNAIIQAKNPSPSDLRYCSASIQFDVRFDLWIRRFSSTRSLVDLSNLTDERRPDRSAQHGCGQLMDEPEWVWAQPRHNERNVKTQHRDPPRKVVDDSVHHRCSNIEKHREKITPDRHPQTADIAGPMPQQPCQQPHHSHSR